MRRYKVVLKNNNEYAFSVLAGSRLKAAEIAAIGKRLKLKAFLNIYTIEKKSSN